MKELLKKIKKARFVFVCGNGGSAATAEHFTNDLFSKGIKAICLNSNVSIMTMIANDFGYGEVYIKQLQVYGNSKDLLITISCSGSSSNICMVQEYAHIIEMDHYEFETFFEFGRKDYEALENKHLQLVHKIRKAL